MNIQKIQKSGYKLRNSINRLVSDKYMYKNESEYLNNINLDILIEAYGDIFYLKKDITTYRSQNKLLWHHH